MEERDLLLKYNLQWFAKEGPGGEKIEPATAKKLKDAREEGKVAKADDDINVITLGGDYLTINEAICIIRNWLATEFKGGRYAERLEMINDIESQNMK